MSKTTGSSNVGRPAQRRGMKARAVKAAKLQVPQVLSSSTPYTPELLLYDTLLDSRSEKNPIVKICLAAETKQGQIITRWTSMDSISEISMFADVLRDLQIDVLALADHADAAAGRTRVSVEGADAAAPIAGCGRGQLERTRAALDRRGER